MIKNDINYEEKEMTACVKCNKVIKDDNSFCECREEACDTEEGNRVTTERCGICGRDSAMVTGSDGKYSFTCNNLKCFNTSLSYGFIIMAAYAWDSLQRDINNLKCKHDSQYFKQHNNIDIDNKIINDLKSRNEKLSMENNELRIHSPLDIQVLRAEKNNLDAKIYLLEVRLERLIVENKTITSKLESEVDSLTKENKRLKNNIDYLEHLNAARMK